MRRTTGVRCSHCSAAQRSCSCVAATRPPAQHRVTNGPRHQHAPGEQDRYVAGWVVRESAGCARECRVCAGASSRSNAGSLSRVGHGCELWSITDCTACSDLAQHRTAAESHIHRVLLGQLARAPGSCSTWCVQVWGASSGSSFTMRGCSASAPCTL